MSCIIVVLKGSSNGKICLGSNTNSAVFEPVRSGVMLWTRHDPHGHTPNKIYSASNGVTENYIPDDAAIRVTVVTL